MKSVHDRAVSLGCPLVLFALLASIIWTLVRGWQHGIWILATLGIGLLLGAYSKYRRKREIRAIINAAFASRGLAVPSYRDDVGMYGYPGYELSFASECDEQSAIRSGAITAFKEQIQELHRDDGSEERPFDAELAVHTTYPGKAYSVQSENEPSQSSKGEQ
jgi:hypothetical protein